MFTGTKRYLHHHVKENITGPLHKKIYEKLAAAYSPFKMRVFDASEEHFGHAEVRDQASAETHFEVFLVSKMFEGQPTLKRHRMVYKTLEEEMNNGIHALQLKLLTEEEHKKSSIEIEAVDENLLSQADDPEKIMISGRQKFFK